MGGSWMGTFVILTNEVVAIAADTYRIDSGIGSPGCFVRTTVFQSSFVVIDHQLGFRILGLAPMHDPLRITAVDLRTGHPDIFAGKLHRFDDNRSFGPRRQT